MKVVIGAEVVSVTTQEEADAVFGAGSYMAAVFHYILNPRPAPPDGKWPVYGLASLTEEEREEFSRCVDAAVSGDDDESTEATQRILELANGEAVKA